MFGDKSSNVFWNMIKNQKENKIKSNGSSSVTNNKTIKKRNSTYLEKQSNQFGNKTDGDPIDIISNLPTYKKICILQGLLKEMKSIKERFEDNKMEMLEKIKKNCYNYYNSKIGMKEIYDYCESENPEVHIDYVLIENSEEILSNNYQILNDILFILRDNNDIMLKIINNCPTNSYDQLADFLVNFFYENTINSTFNEEELMVLIYLIIEDLIMNKLSFSTENNKNENILNNSILYHIFMSITRKADVRNFTCTVLTETLLKLEGFNEDLTILTKKIVNNLNATKNNTQVSSNVKKEGIKRNYSYVPEMGKFGKKLMPPINNFNRENSLSNVDEGEENSRRINSIDIDDKLNIDNIELSVFFKETDVTLKYLNEKISEYENEKQNMITIAMKDFLDLQINQISNENCEIFSNSAKSKEIKTYFATNGKEDCEILVKTMIDNYTKLTDFIDEILQRLKDNITSSPYILKSISIIIEILLDKKFPKNKKKSMDYQKLMFLSNYFIGNIFLPLITNPDFNGIVTTDVISKITKENLAIITRIMNKMLSGKLFTKKELEFTIFNKFIIDTLPKIFDIIIRVIIQKNFNLSKKIQKLIESSDSIGNPKRNINYEYFNENQENIQQQSICFSWLNLIILIDLFKLSNDLSSNEKYKNNKLLFDKFIKLREFCVDKFNDNINNGKREFFIFDKVKYSPNFLKNINNILDENIFHLMPNKVKDEVSIFKKCLVDVLAYVNILHKENFNYFVQKNGENIIQDNDIIYRLINEEINKNYNQTEFEGEGKASTKKSDKEPKGENSIVQNLRGLEENEDEDADFMEVIFPQIIDSVKSELSHNLESDKAKRIVFSSSYLQVHINNLPQKYKDNNFCLLLLEIMKKGEEIISELNVSILYEFYLKVKGGEKLNMIISSNHLQIKRMEKCICIEYLFDNLNLPCRLNVTKDAMGIITNVKYEPIDDSISYVHSIQSFIKVFPDFRKYEKKVDDIIELEEKVELDVALNAYFKDLKAEMKKQVIVSRFNHDELDSISNDLENYILFKLYDKLFPKESTKNDVKFYKKCCRLDFVRPENLIKDKKMINEKLWKTSMYLINEMDYKLTPTEKVKNFGKAFAILQNSITFCSGKNDLGIDDTISSLIYVILKSKPKNIFSNSKYCQLLLNPDLSKKQYGILLSQIEMIKNIIFDMKYSDLIGVSEAEFGKDE
jgi:hypothetical protein